jgi:hypothetical protein
MRRAALTDGLGALLWGINRNRLLGGLTVVACTESHRFMKQERLPYLTAMAFCWLSHAETYDFG